MFTNYAICKPYCYFFCLRAEIFIIEFPDVSFIGIKIEITGGDLAALAAMVGFRTFCYHLKVEGFGRNVSNFLWH